MNASQNPLISIVILYYNRPEAIKNNVDHLRRLEYKELEIIIVDNASEIPVSRLIGDVPCVKTIQLEKNVGVAGRNEGISMARGEYVITLDDDVFGISDNSLNTIIELFESDEELGAVNFRVVDHITGDQINWCHHRKLSEWSDATFETYEISEGAVAFRASSLCQSGLYPEYFFISHEGADLALRIMNCGYKVIYYPKITVSHTHAPEGRPSWRRYYYDTRNTIWLALRCYSFTIAARKLPVALGALLIYSIRDGYPKYWFLGVYDALKKSQMALGDRVVVSRETWKRFRRIEKRNASFLYMLKIRIFQKKVRI